MPPPGAPGTWLCVLRVRSERTGLNVPFISVRAVMPLPVWQTITASIDPPEALNFSYLQSPSAVRL